MTVPSPPDAPIAPPRPASPWRATPRQLAVLCVAALLLAVGIALTINAGLGVGSWQVFETGLVATTGQPFAVVAVVESLVVLVVAWWWLGQSPGIATVLLSLVVGPVIGVLLVALPVPDALAPRLAMLAGGTLGIGVGVGCYVAAGLGASPQDSLFVGLFTRFRIRPRDARLATDLSLVAVGWLLGGQVGVGTVVLTLALPVVIEPMMRLGARLAGVEPLA